MLVGIWISLQLDQDHDPVIQKGLSVVTFESDAMQVVDVVVAEYKMKYVDLDLGDPT